MPPRRYAREVRRSRRHRVNDRREFSREPLIGTAYASEERRELTLKLLHRLRCLDDRALDVVHRAIVPGEASESKVTGNPTWRAMPCD